MLRQHRELGLNILEQCGGQRHQHRQSIGIVFGLGEQVGGHEVGLGRAVGEDHQLGGTGQHVDAATWNRLLARDDVAAAELGGRLDGSGADARGAVDVTDVRQVKGLEFDYVVLVEVSESAYPSDDEARHLLHIAATRAAHQLWILTTSRPSRLLPEALLERGY